MRPRLVRLGIPFYWIATGTNPQISRRTRDTQTENATETHRQSNLALLTLEEINFFFSLFRSILSLNQQEAENIPSLSLSPSLFPPDFLRSDPTQWQLLIFLSFR